MSENKFSKAKRIRLLVATGVFAALAYVCCVVFHFKADFLTFDLKDAVMAVGAMTLGPIYSIPMTFIVTFIEAVTISSTGPYGFIMNLLSSMTYVGVGSLIYSRRRTINFAVFSMVIASVATVAVMMMANLFITPLYTNMPRESVAAIIPTVLLPFNVTKTVFNTSIVFILYKPVSSALRASGFITGEKKQPMAKPNKKITYTVLLAAVAVALATLIYFFKVLGGTVIFG